jgi:hypothetical protein
LEHFIRISLRWLRIQRPPVAWSFIVEQLQLRLDDLYSHMVQFGIDIYPPVEIRDERTRLTMFYEQARALHDALYDQILLSDAQFKISKEFPLREGIPRPSRSVDTFVLASRGPVFVFPLMLPPAFGATGLEDKYLDYFDEMRKLFFRCLPERRVMRLGLVRDLVFNTGETFCGPFITKQASFGSAALVGGSLVIKYRDEKCNVNLHLDAVILGEATRLPVGQTIEQRTGYGLGIRLDVNNWELKPLEDADMQDVLDRATSLWPGELLEYLKQRISS